MKWARRRRYRERMSARQGTALRVERVMETRHLAAGQGVSQSGMPFIYGAAMYCATGAYRFVRGQRPPQPGIPTVTYLKKPSGQWSRTMRDFPEETADAGVGEPGLPEAPWREAWPAQGFGLIQRHLRATGKHAEAARMLLGEATGEELEAWRIEARVRLRV